MLETPKALHTTQKETERFEKCEDDNNGQSAAKFIKLNSILEKVKNGEINSRRQIYRITGRSKKLLNYLNENKILIPKKWYIETFIFEMKKFKEINNRIPVANEHWNFVRLAKRFYGTWNNALNKIFGIVNQYRYDELTDEMLKKTIINFIKKFQRIPLREEFDGSSYEKPFWSAFINRIEIKKWSEIIKFCVEGNKTIFHFSEKRNGFGRIILYNGKVYLSNKEYLIGKYLTENNIEFDKEVEYENAPYIFDFKLIKYNVFIEYYGIATDEYKARIEKKRKFYNGRKVIEIFKHENTIKKLDEEVQRL